MEGDEKIETKQSAQIIFIGIYIITIHYYLIKQRHIFVTPSTYHQNNFPITPQSNQLLVDIWMEMANWNHKIAQQVLHANQHYIHIYTNNIHKQQPQTVQTIISLFLHTDTF